MPDAGREAARPNSEGAALESRGQSLLHEYLLYNVSVLHHVSNASTGIMIECHVMLCDKAYSNYIETEFESGGRWSRAWTSGRACRDATAQWDLAVRVAAPSNPCKGKSLMLIHT